MYSALDQGMGHRRRFSSSQLRKMLEGAGLDVVEERQFNKIGAIAWRVFGTLLGRRKMNRPALKLWDKTVWFWRRVDGVFPWRGLSLIAVGRKR